MSTSPEHHFDTTPVLIYPITFDGKRNKKAPISIVSINNKRLAIPANGLLIPKWEADYIINSLKHRHVYDENLLRQEGINLEDNPGEYRRKLGTITDKSKFHYEIPSSDLLKALVNEAESSIDMKAYNAIRDASDVNRKIDRKFGNVIRTSLKQNPHISIEELFNAFGSLVEAEN